MRIPGVLAASLAATLLLSSCAPSSSPSAHPTSTPSLTASTPAFRTSSQSATDHLPAGVATAIEIGEDSTRYQGRWDGRDVFLAIKNSSSVCLVTGTSNDVTSWVAGCGTGNEVVTWTFPDGGVIKYLPMTASASPEGWTRLSEYVFAM